jgi:hypothetical protein
MVHFKNGADLCLYDILNVHWLITIIVEIFIIPNSVLWFGRIRPVLERLEKDVSITNNKRSGFTTLEKTGEIHHDSICPLTRTHPFML